MLNNKGILHPGGEEILTNMRIFVTSLVQKEYIAWWCKDIKF